MAPTVGFGTSGVRALVTDLSAHVVASYVRVFIQHLRQTGQMKPGTTHCVVGWDLRPSSPAIAAAVCAGLLQEGLECDWAGCVPTPALALRALQTGCPGIMVTGSHIPFDRNGIKFYTAQGEILKADEAAMAQLPLPVFSPQDTFSALLNQGVAQVKAQAADSAALTDYVKRYTQLLPAQTLQGMRVGVYQHSAVGRDILVQLLTHFGATVVTLGRSDAFVPIDTEAVSTNDEAMAAQWCAQHRLDAVVSTDGDGDRPWVCDEQGRFMRGDVLGTLTALWLGVHTVVTPVSSNTALEKSVQFRHTHRTRIGSPYVIEAMQALEQAGHTRVAGFEANGGFLLQTQQNGMQPLPTRDSTLPILAVLCMSKQKDSALSDLAAMLPARFTQSDRIQNVTAAKSQRLIAQLAQNPQALKRFVAFTGNNPSNIDQTDGLRITLSDDAIIHLRPSGNAPELRCYTEAESAEKALHLLRNGLEEIQKTLREQE
ncbi:phosphomannomutase [Hydrogenophaga sp.]|uniref:phosphomannomutase n=1 Tax=Hydrogenophaga sp. TaxID=1904254 RepID=UPI003F6AE140